MDNLWIALGLTVFAGMATGIGSILAFMTPRTNYRFLSFGTGFSAGVMLYVSFVEIFSEKGASALIGYYGEPLGHWVNAIAFFCGIGIIGLIDALIPSHSRIPMKCIKKKNLSHCTGDGQEPRSIQRIPKNCFVWDCSLH